VRWLRLTRVSLIPARAAYRSMADAGGRAAVAGLDVVLASPYMQEAVDHVLARMLVEHGLERMLDRPELEQILDQLLESPGAERLVTQVIESRLVEDAVTQLVDGTASSGSNLAGDRGAVARSIVTSIRSVCAQGDACELACARPHAVRNRRRGRGARVLPRHAHAQDSRPDAEVQRWIENQRLAVDASGDRPVRVDLERR
jgi:hypothetical protein